jgi:hypothetical protein
MRETCQVFVPDPPSDEYRQCDAPAVDFYIGTDGKKCWHCAYHWDIHMRAIAMMVAEGNAKAPSCCSD